MHLICIFSQIWKKKLTIKQLTCNEIFNQNYSKGISEKYAFVYKSGP